MNERLVVAAPVNGSNISNYKEMSTTRFDSYFIFEKQGPHNVVDVIVDGETYQVDQNVSKVIRQVRPVKIDFRETMKLHNNLVSKDNVPVGEAVKVVGKDFWTLSVVLSRIYTEEYGWRNKVLPCPEEINLENIIVKLNRLGS